MECKYYQERALNFNFTIPNLVFFAQMEFVQYAAMLLFETYQKNDGKYYLSISYRRHYNDLQADRLFIPKCGFQCELGKMAKVYAHILPTLPFAEACNQPIEQQCQTK